MIPLGVLGSAISASVTYYDEVMADSPAMYWRLGESSGTTAADASGNGRTGTYSGTYTLGATGLVGDGDKAVTFGDDGKVTRANESWMDDRTCTFECVFRAANTNQGTILLLGGNAVLWGGDKLKGYLGNWHDYAATLTTATTYHLAWVLTSANGAGAIYINGATYASIGEFDRNPATGPLTAGAWIWSFAGEIDEVAYYTEPLSSARILAHAQAAGLA